MQALILESQVAGKVSSAISNWWGRRRDSTLRVAAVLMLMAALVWLSYQFWRLLLQEGYWGAVDLRYYHRFVQRWFAGEPIYSQFRDAIHPPATYAILWPLLGWISFTSARWLWAATTLSMLAWLAYLVVRESGADRPSERLCAALVPFSMYATGATIGNGQLIVHILPVLIFALLSLRHRPRSWLSDLLIASLVLVTLVKPSISALFFWVVLFAPGSWRPAFLVVFGYAALTLWAVSFQETDLATLLTQWTAQSSAVAIIPGHGNVSNLHIWLAGLGLREWILPMSMVVLLAHGAWVYYHGNVDLWLLLGVTGYITRYWTYHRWYDDLLVLLPMVALFAIAKKRPANDPSALMAGGLLAATMLSTLAPGGLFLFPPPWNTLYIIGQNIIWITGLIFLLYQAARAKASCLAAQ